MLKDSVTPNGAGRISSLILFALSIVLHFK